MAQKKKQEENAKQVQQNGAQAAANDTSSAEKSYEYYEGQQLGKAKEQGDAYAADRRSIADRSAHTADTSYRQAVQQAEKDYRQSAADTEKSYRAVYDANVVGELVARRQAAEAIANAGAANSGLNNTQQTAISLSRSRADANTTSQKQAAVDSIMRELDRVRAQYAGDNMAAKERIYSAADQDILNYKNSLEQTARQNAASLYASDREAAAAQAQLEFDRQQADRDYELNMLKEGYVYDSETGGYQYVGTDQTRSEYEREMLKQGYRYDPETNQYVPFKTEAERLAYLNNAADLEIANANNAADLEIANANNETKKEIAGAEIDIEKAKMGLWYNEETGGYEFVGTAGFVDKQAEQYFQTVSREKAISYIENMALQGVITEEQKISLIGQYQNYGFEAFREEVSVGYKKEYSANSNLRKPLSQYAAHLAVQYYNEGKLNATEFEEILENYNITTYEVEIAERRLGVY